MIENENGDHVLAIKEPCLYDDKMASKNMKTSTKEHYIYMLPEWPFASAR